MRTYYSRLRHWLFLVLVSILFLTDLYFLAPPARAQYRAALQNLVMEPNSQIFGTLGPAEFHQRTSSSLRVGMLAWGDPPPRP